MFMGTDYGPPPPGLVSTAFGKFFGMPPDPSGTADTLCAVVAREYRIPAVVGTGVAASTIKDGQTIKVDGDAGLVRIVD